MNALLPGDPHDENAKPMTAAGERPPAAELAVDGVLFPERPPAVEVLSAEKVFTNGTRGLAPIDLAIADGEFLTLIGPSGCGKSTLLKLIANLIDPSDGRLLWWRGDFAQVGQEGRRLAFVFAGFPDHCASGRPNLDGPFLPTEKKDEKFVAAEKPPATKKSGGALWRF